MLLIITACGSHYRRTIQLKNERVFHDAWQRLLKFHPRMFIMPQFYRAGTYTSGCCTFLGANCVSWSAKKQPIIAWSTIEAEY